MLDRAIVNAYPSTLGTARNKRRLLVAALTLAISGAFASSTPILASEHGATGNLRKVQIVGTNLGSSSYYSDEFPLLNLMHGASSWWDADIGPGGAIAVRPGKVASVIVSLAAPADRKFVVLHDGKGRIGGWLGTELQRDTRAKNQYIATPSRAKNPQTSAYVRGELRLAVHESDATDPIRNIRVVEDRYLSNFQNGGRFNPDWLRRVETFDVLRFMDLMKTNHLYGPNGAEAKWDNAGKWHQTPQIAWSDRPRVEDISFERGWPVEVLVDLANAANVDPWFNMPINASDDYIRGFAEFVKQNLNPNLSIQIELGNEIWNWANLASGYSAAQGHLTWGRRLHMQWYALRSAEMSAIWKTVFGQSLRRESDHPQPGRVRVVISTQAAWLGLEKLMFSESLDRNGRSVDLTKYFDDYAIAAYYGYKTFFDASRKEWVQNTIANMRNVEISIEELSREIRSEMAKIYNYHATVAKKFGFRFISYEGGYHALGAKWHQEDDRIVKFLIELQRNRAIYDVELANLNAFSAAGGSLYVNFGLIGSPSKYGAWTLLENSFQQTSPRLDALMTWVDERLASGGHAQRNRRPAHNSNLR